MRFTYNKQHLDFIAEAYRQMSLAEVAEAFTKEFGVVRTESQIRAACKNHKIKCGRSTGELNRGKYTSMTLEQVEWLREQYQVLKIGELTAAFNAAFCTDKSKNQIRAFLKNHKITCNRSGHFKKGEQPWNTGTKGVMKANRGTFTKGQVPPNLKPLWSERICSKDGYILMKVPERDPYTGFPTRFKLKHIWVWEQANGPVPEGMMVKFIDGDRLNCELENLELISRAENAILNKMRFSSLPAELQPSARLLAKVYTARSERKEQTQ